MDVVDLTADLVAALRTDVGVAVAYRAIVAAVETNRITPGDAHRVAAAALAHVPADRYEMAAVFVRHAFAHWTAPVRVTRVGEATVTRPPRR